MTALAGKRVLVTRAREQAGKTAAAIRERGAEPVLLPMIEIHPAPDAEAVTQAITRMEAGSYEWVAFTSANGVEQTWRAVFALGKDAHAFRRTKIAAIGPGTSKALAEHGLVPVVVARELLGEGLAAAMRAEMARGERVLVLRAAVARDVLPDLLRAEGHAVDVVAVYETRAPQAGAGGDGDGSLIEVMRALEVGAMDAVTFTSGSTVDSFVGLVGGAERAAALLARTIVASIGPITSEALARHGLRVDATAKESTIPGLLDAIEDHLREAAAPSA